MPFSSARRRCRGALRLAAALIALSGYPQGAAALEEITLRAGPSAGHGWSVAALEARLKFQPADSVSFSLVAAGVQLPEPLQGVREIRAECAQGRLSAAGVACRGGTIVVVNEAGLPRLEPASFEFEYADDRFLVKLDELRFGDGELSIDLGGTGDRWWLQATARNLPLGAAMALAGGSLSAPNLKVSTGSATGSVRWESNPASGTLTAKLKVAELGFSDASGLNAGEKLSVDLGIDAARNKGVWRYTVDSRLSAGQAYFHPVFVDADNSAFQLAAEGSFDPRDGELHVHRFNGTQQGVVEITGRSVLEIAAAELKPLSLEAEARVLELKPFHAVYLEPWLVNSALAGAELGGQVEASLSWRSSGASDLNLRVRNLSVDDAQARFGLLGVNGVIRWSSEGVENPTKLEWKSAHFYRIDVGAGELVGRFQSQRFQLEQPVLFPLLGGVLVVDTLSAEELGTEAVSWRFGGRLTPISLGELTNRLAWPAFSGSVSGVIPAVRYAGGEITVDGALSMNAFDGAVQISDLKLSQPFGVVPRASANVRLSGLSLDELTRTFSFGNIQGRLDGRIDNLVMENWRPAEFDAKFVTPEDDTSRHRISQRAVDNLASLGGAGRVLSSTALRFLESFSYDRLGISCRLRNGICDMGGVEPANRGYYIVKGGGLPPRIDVLGYNTRVDWNKLVQRLKAARFGQAVIR